MNQDPSIPNVKCNVITPPNKFILNMNSISPTVESSSSLVL